MSGLGDLLELLHGARQRWQTVRLVVRRWYEPERGRSAMERGAEQARARGGGVSILVTGSPRTSEEEAEIPKASESLSRLWLDPGSDRVRMERSDPHGDFYSVRVGERWWSYHPIWGATTNEGDLTARIGGPGEVEALLDPALLLGSLDFETIGERTGAGRDGIVVRATPRALDDSQRLRPYLPEGADDFELLVDVERGIVLRLEARLDGEPFMIIELIEVQFDETFAEEVFVFQAPPGEQVRSHRDVYARPEGVSIEEAVRRAPFTVLAPRRLPEGWAFNVLYAPGRDRPPAEPSVVMYLKDPTGLHQLRILQQAEPLPDSLDWVGVDIDGERLFVWEPQGRLNSDIEAKLQRGGTHARLTGDVDRTTLLEIANSLRAASPDIPLVDQ